jgi:TctA family transporter
MAVSIGGGYGSSILIKLIWPIVILVIVILILNFSKKREISKKNSSGKSRLLAALLCFFIGFLGIHRFYVGKVGTGILYLLSGGFFGIGVFIDFILIIFGSFTDTSGKFLHIW